MGIESPWRNEEIMIRWIMLNKKIIGPYFFRQSSVDAAACKSALRYFSMYHIEQLAGSSNFWQDSWRSFKYV